jgi:hypothetical protein
MPGPFIVIATNRLRDGRFDAEQQRVPALCSFIEASEPRLIAFNEYVNEERSEVTVVQVHPDAASFDFHLGVVGDRARDAYVQTLEATTSIEDFGTPTETILGMLRRQAGSGVHLNIDPHHLGGLRARQKAEQSWLPHAATAGRSLSARLTLMLLVALIRLR